MIVLLSAKRIYTVQGVIYIKFAIVFNSDSFTMKSNIISDRAWFKGITRLEYCEAILKAFQQ